MRFVAMLIALLTCCCDREIAFVPTTEHQAAAVAPVHRASPPPAPAGVEGPAPAAAAPPPVIGTGTLLRAPRVVAASAPSDGADVSFSFVDADIRDVMRELLGDQLHLGYAVDPKVQAKITAQTGGPIPRSAVLPTLESILRASGVALVEAGGIYRAVPLEEASKESTASLAQPRMGQPGYGIRVLPLKFIKAAEVKSILDPFVPPGGVLQIDDPRNLLIVAGPSADLEGFVLLVRQLDVNWLAGKSFAIYPLRVAKAKDIASELQTILEQGGKEAGPLGNMVRAVPIERLNAILVISSQPSYLAQMRTWIDRLDYGEDSTAPRFFKYQVQNTRSVDLARVLREMFSSGDVRIVRPEKSPGPNFTQLSANPPGAGGVAATLPGTVVPIGAAAPRPPPAPPPEERPEAAPAAAPEAGANELALPQARIVADEKNNTLVVFARPQDYRLIYSMLQQLDVAPQQVLIEATIAELTLNDALQYGLQFYLKDAASRFELTTSASGNLSATDLAGVFPGFNYVVASTTQHAILSMLRSVSTIKVLSSPQLLVRDNQTAGLQVGAQVPIVIQSAVSVISAGAPIVNSIEYRNTGVILQVTPRINANGMIALDIDQEVSDVATTTSSTINSPTINDRHLVSSIIVHDGETVALGGLIRADTSDTKSGIPVLSEIPGIGPLFRTTARSRDRTELIVLLSPRVVRGIDDARAMTDDLRSRIRALPPLAPKDQRLAH
ncbi:MAG TPA: type II secretion system secretin GspD [Stellaceae bacterium]|nr:type II secretion system secretin GspD [Stellaceae bacterium]